MTCAGISDPNFKLNFTLILIQTQTLILTQVLTLILTFIMAVIQPIIWTLILTLTSWLKSQAGK